jgi:hypothetical protein
MNKLTIIFLTAFLLGFLIPVASADLGTFKQNSCISLYQFCSDCSYVNVTSIQYPDGTIESLNEAMTKNDVDYNYTFCNTSNLGNYYYVVKGDAGGSVATERLGFSITLNGKPNPEGFLIVIYSLIFIAIFFFGLFFFFQGLEQAIQFDMDLYDTIKIVGTYLAMWIFYYFSFEYWGNNFVNEMLETAISVGAVTHVFLPFVAFFVSFIMKTLQFKQKARITY